MLSVREAAKRLGVSQALVYGWCATRRLAHLRLGRKGKRGAIKIDEADLQAFMEECRKERSEEAPVAVRVTPIKLKHLEL